MYNSFQYYKKDFKQEKNFEWSNIGTYTYQINNSRTTKKKKKSGPKSISILFRYGKCLSKMLSPRRDSNPQSLDSYYHINGVSVSYYYVFWSPD